MKKNLSLAAKKQNRDEVINLLSLGASPRLALKEAILHKGGVKTFQLFSSLGVNVLSPVGKISKSCSKYEMLKRAVSTFNFQVAAYLLRKISPEQKTALFLGRFIDRVFKAWYYNRKDKTSKKKRSRLLRLFLGQPAAENILPGERGVEKKISFLCAAEDLDRDFSMMFANSDKELKDGKSVWDYKQEAENFPLLEEYKYKSSFSSRYPSKNRKISWILYFLQLGASPYIEFMAFVMDEESSLGKINIVNYLLQSPPPAKRPWKKLGSSIASYVLSFCHRRDYYQTVNLALPFVNKSVMSAAMTSMTQRGNGGLVDHEMENKSIRDHEMENKSICVDKLATIHRMLRMGARWFPGVGDGIFAPKMTRLALILEKMRIYEEKKLQQKS